MKMLKVLLAAAICAVSFTASAGFVCNVDNEVKNTHWKGTGPTREAALNNAMDFCSKNSEHARNCKLVECHTE